MRVCIIGAIVVAIGVCPTVFAGDPNLLQTFVKPPPRNFARFGESTTSEDGDVLISGELCHAAYLYSGSTGELLKTIPSPQPNLDDSFGFSSAYANGITYISAGHNSDKQQNSGCVYVYEPLTNIPIRTLYAPKPTDGGGFGFALAARGDKLLVGNFSETVIAPVYEFDSLGNVLLSLQNPGSSQKNHFGGSVAFVGDKIAVGAPGFSRTGGVVGAVYIFNSTTGELERTLHSPHQAKSDFFGFSIMPIGDKILIGSPLESTKSFRGGAAYLFDSVTGELIQSFYNPAAIGPTGMGGVLGTVNGTALIGAANYLEENDGGAIFAFDPITGALLHTYTNPHPTFNTAFAAGGNIAELGSNFVTGAWADQTYGITGGVAYMFRGAVVPEPSSFVLCAIGTGGAIAMRLRRRVDI